MARAVAAVMTAAGTCVPVWAEPDPPEKLSAELIAAQMVARLALEDLRATGTPTVEDYAIASDLLSTAATLAPEDQTILRLWLEAASSAEDSGRVREIARRLLKIDGSDTVSQLRVISSNIADMQTADDRLRAYDRLLGDDGKAFDDSVRSRLALDAALLVRERGDLQGFAERLMLALQLDPTNKDAATLALTFHSSRRPEDVLGRADLMLNVLYADPFDPEVYQSLTGLMLESGSTKGAARFASLSRRLHNLLGVAPFGEDRTLLDLAEWNALGPETVIQRLSAQLEHAREQVSAERKALELAGKPADGVPRAQDIRLPFGMERMRLIAAASLGDKERASTFLMELAETGRQQAEMLLDPVKRPAEINQDEVTDRLQQYRAEMVWLRCWSGLQLDEAATGLQLLREGGHTDTATMARLETWLALRSGDRDVAERAFGDRAAADPLSMLGLAVLAEMKGDRGTAAERYADVVKRVPHELAGAYSRTRYTAMTGMAPEAGELARELDEMAAGVPGWVDGLIDEPRRTVSLETQAVHSEIRVMERTPVRVTLRNNAPIPLGLGPGRPIDSRLLFSPTVDVGAQKLPAAELVQVVSMDRKLRLMPNEEVSVIAWPDFGELSSAMELTANKQARVRWRVIQGFALNDQRQYEPCPQCTTADTAMLVRRPPNRYEAVPEAMRLSLQTAGARELSETIQSLVLRMATPLPNETLTLQDIDALVEVLARRFSTMQRASKTIVLCQLPTTPNIPPSIRVDQIAAQDGDEHVLAVQLAFRTYDPGDAVFKSPKLVEVERLANLAALVKKRLVEKRPCFALMRLQVPEMIAPVQTGDARPTAAEAARAAKLLPIAPDPEPVPNVP